MAKINKLASIVATAARMEKKAEEIEPGSIYEQAKAILPKEDIDHHETDLYLRVSPKSTELVNSMKYRNSGMITTFKDNIDGDMWYELPFCYPYIDSKEYKNVPSKEEDEIILRQKKSSKRVKLTKKASMDLEEIKVFADDVKTICDEIKGFGYNVSKAKVVQKFNKIIELANDVIEEMK